jgi:hypothetical protein
MRAKPAQDNASASGTFLAHLEPSTMAKVHAGSPPIEIVPPPLGSVEDRERRLIEAVVALARSLRDERDRLAARLREVELELSRLAPKLDARAEATDIIDSLRGTETVVRAARLRRPNRTSA